MEKEALLQVLEVNKITFQEAALDFSTSAQIAYHSTNQILCNDVMIVNGDFYVEWCEGATQLLICEECGYSGCASNGYVYFRKAGDYVIIIPPFFEVDEECDIFGMPYWMNNYSSVILNEAYYNIFTSSLTGFPNFESVPSLEMREVCEVIKRIALSKSLNIDDVNIIQNRRDIIATNFDSDDQALSHLEILLQSEKRGSEINLKKKNSKDFAIDFFIHDGDVHEWTALIMVDDQPYLALDKDYYFEIKA